LVVDGASGPTIPNQFSVAVNDADLDPDIDIEQLTRQLNLTLQETATDRGWRIGGPIDVHLTTDPSVGKGLIKCTATTIPASLPPWGELAEHRGEREFSLGDNRSIIGRSDSVDIKLDEAEVSRHHAVIFREGGRIWIMDLGSANGTTVNGNPVMIEAAEIGPGDMLAFGPSTFALRTVLGE
jgi:hypothetical protein